MIRVHKTQYFMKKNANAVNAGVLTAPCISHPCGSAVGKNPCTNCAFSRTDVGLERGKTQQRISSEEYGCKMGGSIEQHGDNLYMRVGGNLFAEREPVNIHVINAQDRLRVYVGN